jgi:hypothetical protein
MILFLDCIVLCDGSSDNPNTNEKLETYWSKPIFVILVCVGILCSFLLVGYVVTPDNLNSTESTETITYTTVQLPDPSSEESRAAIRAVRDSLNLIGESLEGEK